MSGRSYRFARRDSSGTRAMLPFFVMISQMTPAGVSPARRARSTAASVCPARTSTPPSRARSGEMCPGRSRSCGLVPGATAVRMVAARSAAEMPVVVLPRASMGTHIAVSRAEEFTETASGISSASRRSGVIARHTSPRPCVTMKFTISGVIFSAATVKSPSFSRSSSSTTTAMRPSRIAAIAASTGAKGPERRGTAVSRAWDDRRAGVRFVMIEGLLALPSSATSPARRTCR